MLWNLRQTDTWIYIGWQLTIFLPMFLIISKMDSLGISWQEIAAFVTIIGVGVGFYTSVHVRLRALEIEVTSLQKSQEKTDNKFDQIMEKLGAIMVALSGKQDKH